jgi:hypothetical protein
MSNDFGDLGNPGEVGAVKARGAQVVAVETVYKGISSGAVGCKQRKPQRFTLRW